ncbi:MAG: aminotransferase class I/II-fold pyridoxal phosphate-dependent enzyme [FCB group bacterium]|nr:aminotransferase class I/II-fold pyridoxal phosphate-dependent enzyme [FCB group bacterium]
MSSLNTMTAANIEDLVLMVSRITKADRKMIFPFDNATIIMTELFRMFDGLSGHLMSIGHATPDVALAADRADIKLEEIIPSSPFSGDIKTAIAQIENQEDIIYLANPNKITGANYSLSDLEKLAQLVPKGALIIDEYYYEYYGISGISLLNLFTNVIILRSFTAPFGVYSTDTGYVIANSSLIEKIKSSVPNSKISNTVRKMIYTAMVNEEAISLRLKEIHDESYRISTALHKMEVLCRMTVADFLLLKVASSKDAGNFLNGYKVAVDNLDGYPSMRNYLRYRIESYYSNEKLLKAFEKMPAHYYQTKKIDRRRVTFRHPPEQQIQQHNQDEMEKMLRFEVKERKNKQVITK